MGEEHFGAGRVVARRKGRPAAGRLAPALGAALIGAGLASACGSRVVDGTGGPTLCADDTDCRGTQICASGRCTAGCVTSADCPEGARCVASEGAKVCRLADESTCATNSECPAPLVCAVDGQCRAECLSDRDCEAGQVCSTEGTCTASSRPPIGTGGGPSFGPGGAPSFAMGGSPSFGAGGAGGEICDGVFLRAAPAPVDAYVLLDQSSSMSDPVPGGATTFWDGAIGGFQAFLNAPGAAGTGVGLQYFPLNGIAPASCTTEYATPEVPIAPLPGNAAGLVLSLGQHAPSGFTPTGPALSGAISHLRTFAAASIERVPIAVLVTDGFPTECEPQALVDIAAIASAALAGTPSVRTAVVGLSAGLANLNQIAEAGGTSAAFLIEGGDVGAAFAEALLRIASDPGISCRILLPAGPPGVPFSSTHVNLRVSDAAGVTDTLPRVDSPAACAASGGAGWYYDSVTDPTGLGLCPASCSAVRGRQLDVVYGCPSVIASPR